MIAEVCGWSAEAFADSNISGMAVLPRSSFANFMTLFSLSKSKITKNAKLSFLFQFGPGAI